MMFSGIIQSIGAVTDIHDKQGGKECIIHPHLSYDWNEGASVSVSGVCSTITKVCDGAFTLFYMPETLLKTTIGEWKKGTNVNIEPSLRVGDEVSGHFVFGHIDGVAIIETIQVKGGSRLFWLRVPSRLSIYLAPKGSVALDGVSVTVVETKGDRFSVALIPSTLFHTTLGLQNVGGKVNIEIDMLARYVIRSAKGKAQNAKGKTTRQNSKPTLPS